MSVAAILQYSGVVTKMRAMYKGLLQPKDYEKLMSMSRVADLVRWLKESNGYGRVLQHISETSVHRKTLERAFDNALIEDANKLKHMLNSDGKRMLNIIVTRREITVGTFNTVLESAKKYLPGGDRSIMKYFFGTEAEVQNILWIYRYKKYYDLTEDEILENIIPVCHKLKKEQLRKLTGAKADELGDILAETYYRKIFTEEVTAWDEAAAKYLHKIFMAQMRRNKYSFASLAAYILLKEIDIQNIITIIEGVRYGMEPQQIRKYLTVGEKNEY